MKLIIIHVGNKHSCCHKITEWGYSKIQCLAVSLNEIGLKGKIQLQLALMFMSI